MHAYTDALLHEMRASADLARGMTFDTVFFGGGTPTLLDVRDFDRIICEIPKLFSLENGSEITAEANPASANREKLKALRTLGINRLSIGVQSLHDRELRALGRLHTKDEAIAFYENVREVGFDQVNIDLMYGIPYQTVKSLSQTLDGVFMLNPEHISAYSLMIEEGTPFYHAKNTLALPDEDTEDELDLLIKQRLITHGYQHYEISNYAQKDAVCRHNLHYWRSDPYLGFGVAACSFFHGIRYGNGQDLTAYLAHPTDQRKEETVVSEADLAYEWLMLRLRLAEGISLKEYFLRFGVKLEVKYQALINRFSDDGLLVIKNGRLSLTEKGMRLSNSILVAFMEET